MYGELVICVIGIYACFLTWGVTQERVSTTPYDSGTFKYFVFLNVCQSFAAALVALIYQKLWKRQPIPWPTDKLLLRFSLLSVTQSIGPLFGYASLKHIDYPTMILGKSCKLVPVMVMGLLVYRKSYPLYKYIVVALITIGVSTFTLFHHQDTPSSSKSTSNSAYGLILLGINLAIDGLTNSTQDHIFHHFKSVSGTVMMFYMNLFSSVFMAIYLLIHPYSGELYEAIAFCQAHPAVINDIILFAFCGGLGQCFIFYTLERFGSMSLVTVTVTRKMFSILLSVFLFNHSITLMQWGSVALVFFGIGLEAYAKPGHAKHDASSSVVSPSKKQGDEKKGTKKSSPKKSSAGTPSKAKSKSKAN